MNIYYRVLARSAMTIFCLLGSLALAQQASSTGHSGISLHDAINATLHHNPELNDFGFQLKALVGEHEIAKLRPEFQLVSELENVAGSGEFSGLDASELTLSLASVIELGGQRAARLEVMTARQQQLISSQKLATLELLTHVTQQFIRVLAAQEHLAVQQNAQQLAQENLRLLIPHVQAGKTPELEVLRAKAALARAGIALKNAEQQLASERIHLTAYWADTSPSFSQVRANLFAFSTVASLPELLAQLEQNPELLLLADQALVRSAELRQAQTQGRSNLAWSAGVKHMRATDDSALVFGVSLPLGTKARASGAIRTATANQASAENQRDSAKILLTIQLISLVEARQQALTEVHTLESEVVPLLEQALTAIADAFQRGRYSYLELNLAQQELLEAQSALIDAAARTHLLSADIERLIGAQTHAVSTRITQ